MKCDEALETLERNSGPTDCLNFKNGQENTKAQNYGPAYTAMITLAVGHSCSLLLVFASGH